MRELLIPYPESACCEQTRLKICKSALVLSTILIAKWHNPTAKVCHTSRTCTFDRIRLDRGPHCSIHRIGLTQKRCCVAILRVKISGIALQGTYAIVDGIENDDVGYSFTAGEIELILPLPVFTRWCRGPCVVEWYPGGNRARINEADLIEQEDGKLE